VNEDFPFLTRCIVGILRPHKCRDSRTVHEMRDFFYFVVGAVITVNVRYCVGSGERKAVVTLI